jgi:bromodomain-containing factor 1
MLTKLKIDPITGEIELEIEQIPQDILYELYKIISAKHPDIEIGLRKQHEKVAAPQPLARPPPKKKNKPMSKNEQEKKIEQLNRKMADFSERKASGSPAAQTAPQPILPTIEKQEEPESSGDDASDSEEE